MSLPTSPSGPILSEDARQMAAALLDLIAEDASSEVLLNGPTEVLIKERGTRFHIDEIQFADIDEYHQAINEYVLAYTDTRDRIDGQRMLVEGQLTLPGETPDAPPMLARVHVLCPPLTPHAIVTIAKKSREELLLDDIVESGALTQNMADLLKALAFGRANMVFAGPTGAGKTTLLQAVTHHFDQNDRIVVIEDTPELRLPLGDVAYLHATSPAPGRPVDETVTMEWLVRASNRMRMNRVIVGECRGAEVAEFLIVANSGADGSMTTIHADSPRRALDKMLSLATKSPTAASEQTLTREIAESVDVIVQTSLIDNRHVVTAIDEISRTVTQSNLISSQPLFAFNRATGQHEVAGRPTEALIQKLAAHGVPIDPVWFR